MTVIWNDVLINHHVK